MDDATSDRFWSKTTTADDGSGCILWTACRFDDGYGCFSYKGRTVRAHRWILEQHLGITLVTKQHVLHSCDTPSCVNLDHLRVGDNVQNMHDMVSRKHQMLGTRNNKAKLTYAKASAIRVRYANGGITQTVLAEAYGVDQRTVSMIVLGNYWKSAS